MGPIFESTPRSENPLDREIETGIREIEIRRGSGPNRANRPGNAGPRVRSPFSGLANQERRIITDSCAIPSDCYARTVPKLLDRAACVAHTEFMTLNLPPERRKLAIGEVARAAGCSDSWIRRCDSELQPEHTVHGRIYDRDRVEAWLGRRAARAAAKAAR